MLSGGLEESLPDSLCAMIRNGTYAVSPNGYQPMFFPPGMQARAKQVLLHRRSGFGRMCTGPEYQSLTEAARQHRWAFSSPFIQ